ncbi:MAG: pantetheine-phosphate adenylyltransferase [Actinomycetota bacterium]|nr:pantetheine-phosphate adenylyltransferase [Actinomycetota bacterium]
MRTALNPGSFDPFHNGHLEIVETASELFDQVVVAVIRNPAKTPLFTLEERLEMLTEALVPFDNVKIVAMKKLTVDVAKDVGADVIVKGLRVASDFEYELQQAQMNRAISGIETVFLPCASDSSFIASSLVRQIAQYGGADRVGSMVPPVVAARLREKFNQ